MTLLDKAIATFKIQTGNRFTWESQTLISASVNEQMQSQRSYNLHLKSEFYVVQRKSVSRPSCSVPEFFFLILIFNFLFFAPLLSLQLSLC